MKTTHVLLIDDDDSLRRTLRARLEAFGCRVTDAPDGTAANSIHESDPVDVFICDIVMPRKEGIETIRDFHRAHPTVRIVAMTGVNVPSAQTYLKLATQLGAVDILVKPFSTEQLAHAVGVTPEA